MFCSNFLQLNACCWRGFFEGFVLISIVSPHARASFLMNAIPLVDSCSLRTLCNPNKWYRKFRSFWWKRGQGNTSKGITFFRKISTGMNRSIWILHGISGFSIQMVSARIFRTRCFSSGSHTPRTSILKHQAWYDPLRWRTGTYCRFRSLLRRSHGAESINRSINQRLYLTSNLLITKLLISPKKVNL